MKKMLFVISLSGVVFAEPAALYAAQPPADAAFVRVLDAQTLPLSVRMGNQAFNLAFSDVTPYHILTKGTQRIQFSQKGKTVDHTLNVEAGRFYSVVVSEGLSIKTLADQYSGKLTKSRIHVYNLSDLALQLKTSDGKTTLIDSLAPNSYQMLSVNPVKASLGVFEKNVRKSTTPQTQLVANTAYSLVVFSPSQAVWTQNSTQP